MVRSHHDWLGWGPRAPDHLVFFTDNFMEDFFWCLDLREFKGEHPVVFWTPHPLEAEVPGYPSFERFIAAELAFQEAKHIA
jgi:hypothetical protein